MVEFFKSDTLYYIFHQVLRFHYQRTHMLLDDIGLYPGQPGLLFALSVKDGQSQKDLANKLNIKPATITVMLNRMEKSNLVERHPDPEDQRVSRVYITKQGKEVCNELRKVMKIIDSECFKNFTEEEKVILRRLLMQMRDNLSEACDKKSEI